MSISFAEVTDITIPEGNVERITEASGEKRVLWEKKLAVPKMHWEFVDIDLKNENIANMACCIDTGDGVEIFTDNTPAPLIKGHFKYYQNGTVGDFYTLWRGSKIQADDSAMVEYKKLSSDEQATTTPPVSDATWSYGVYDADIDPISNKWICTSTNRYYASNISSSPKWKNHNLGSYNGCCVCWSPKLKLFCVATNKNFYLLDTSGNVKGASEDHSLINMSNYNSSLIWVPSLEKFVFMGGAAPKLVYTSSDGLTWETKTKTVDGTSSSVSFMRNICWMPNLNKFVALRAYLTKFYIYTSNDGIEWQYLRSLSTGYSDAGLADTNGRLSYSTERRVLLVTGHYASYLTRDLENWVNMPYIEGESTVGSHVLLGWSKTFNAFLLRWGTHEAGERIQRLGKLVIDN